MDAALKPPAPVKVLFLCIGNMCRSPMAEGFARHLCGGRLQVWSAGFAPSGRTSSMAVQVMAEKGIDISGQRSKGIREVPVEEMDWIVSLGEVSATVAAPPAFAGRTVDWRVRDPIGESLEVYRRVRDEIERRIEGLLQTIEAED